MKRWLISLSAAALAAAILAGGLTIAIKPAAAEGTSPLVQIFALVTCASGNPCQTYVNSRAGAGLEGVSTKGNGLVGLTKSTSVGSGHAGVLGLDLSASGTNDAGVAGTSTNGNGVVGTTSHGIGVSGTTGNGIGMSGTANNSGIGVKGVSIVNDAVQGVIGSGVASSFHAGVAGLDRSTSGTTNQGVYGDTTLGIGVQGVSLSKGIGVYGSSADGVGVNAAGGSADGTLPALSIVTTGNGPADLIDACLGGTVNPCDATSSFFAITFTGFLQTQGGIFAQDSILSNGNIEGRFVQGQDVEALNGSMIISGSGSYTKNGSCVAGCTVSATSARRVRTYGAQSSQPTVEDYGEAQLAGGQAFVHLDPAFANVIDQHARYLVVITPEGDSNGLYVTQQTLSGFMVRENRGGKSSLAFNYRVAARPFGATEARLPMIDEPLRPRHTIARPSHRGSGLRVH